VFIAAATLLFTGSVAITIAWCASMAAMPGMPMPGGWTMTMTWMRMGEQTWLEGAASFLAMWMVMMVAMMLPSLAPALWRCRDAVRRTGESRPGRMTMLVGAGYLSVWAVAGAVVYVLGLTFAELAMRQPALSRAVPLGIGAIALVAIALQFTSWKARQLACWRAADRICLPAPTAGRVWQSGLRMGWDCVRSSGNLMMILLVLGLMDLVVMAAVTAAITLERLVPPSEARL
jgi:predicted metal-binding membrane protein